jgi:hypothetical protein
MPVKTVFISFCIMPRENQSQPKLQHALNDDDDLIISMNSVSGFYACITTTNCFEI